MSNNRSTLELLKIMLSNINILTSGLCGLAKQLYDNGVINVEEAIRIQQYIESQRPGGFQQYSYWWESLSYWWPKGEIQPRKEWLENQIKLLENTSNHDN